MKKRSYLFFISMFASLLFLVQFVSASYGGSFDLRSETENLINLVVDFTEPFLQAVFGGDYWDGQMLFEKFLLFAILVAIVYVAVSKAPFFNKDNKPLKGVIWTISFIVPILSIRYIDMGWLNTILMTYQAFGIAMTTLLPLIIYFFFLQGVTDSSTISKIGWILFICVFLGLYTTTDRDNYSQWYFFTAIVAFVFLLADGTIRRYLDKQKQNEGHVKIIMDQIARLEGERKALQNLPPSTQTDWAIKSKEREIEQYYEKIRQLRHS